MKTFSFEDSNPNLLVHGAADYDKLAFGLGVRRLPAWTRPQEPQDSDVMLRMPSGVRIQLETDSSRIGIESLTPGFGGA